VPRDPSSANPVEERGTRFSREVTEDARSSATAFGLPIEVFREPPSLASKAPGPIAQRGYRTLENDAEKLAIDDQEKLQPPTRLHETVPPDDLIAGIPVFPYQGGRTLRQ